jgi:glycosyltransferase involved in cell wall biosynthesis
MPKISVIVPVHNTEKFLGKCLDSLVAETIEDIEFILIDDASTDKSNEILTSYQKKYPNKIKLIRLEKNQGAAVARNK